MESSNNNKIKVSLTYGVENIVEKRKTFWMIYDLNKKHIKTAEQVNNFLSKLFDSHQKSGLNVQMYAETYIYIHCKRLTVMQWHKLIGITLKET